MLTTMNADVRSRVSADLKQALVLGASRSRAEAAF